MLHAQGMVTRAHTLSLSFVLPCLSPQLPLLFVVSLSSLTLLAPSLLVWLIAGARRELVSCDGGFRSGSAQVARIFG